MYDCPADTRFFTGLGLRYPRIAAGIGILAIGSPVLPLLAEGLMREIALGLCFMSLLYMFLIAHESEDRVHELEEALAAHKVQAEWLRSNPISPPPRA